MPRSQSQGGAHFANDVERARRIARSNGEAIAHRTIERRVVTVGGDVYCKHATGGHFKRDCFHRRRRERRSHRGQHNGAGIGEAERRRHIPNCSGFAAGWIEAASLQWD